MFLTEFNNKESLMLITRVSPLTGQSNTLDLDVTSGPLDVIGNMHELAIKKPDSYYLRNPVKPTHIQVNLYWISEHYTGKVLAFMQELKAAMQGPDWYDRSDLQTEYFDTSWYININIGRWNQPYQLTA
jgi:hypothetical protein